ncbi:proline-rich spliceosome-associated (PSP) family protein [Actinidia rufa]|uniref:Proline-rich spliceosome-associated (PSP) family protein n=1 Tax=Actinidia rufa TaxID=165716 RepID=A0A7J0DWF8_9ERIC|nr:proline-rich spliceosome-associated (PSP) family protein [Actinidia rufa]
MESDDVINLPASCNSGYKSENDGVHDSICEPRCADSQLSNSEVKEGKLKGEISRTSEVDVGHGVSQPFVAADTDGNLIGSSSFLQASVELNETVSVAKDEKRFSSGIQTENGCRTVQDGSPISNRKRGGSPINNHEIDGGSISEVKKARMTVDEHQPSVHVTYNYLTRDSKQKLEELLLQWSEWHTQNCSSCHDSSEVLESGEETYFPALRLGLDNPSSVEFVLQSLGVEGDRWDQVRRGLEIVDASRCFNCGSYNHSLKDCPKPRDNKAVNNARNQHKSRRNQNASSRNPTRYYQSSPKGKYDGLKPGVLDAETQKTSRCFVLLPSFKLLDELDPPPWLNRMREIGYPPGYLDFWNAYKGGLVRFGVRAENGDWGEGYGRWGKDAEYEDQPSGIMIFADEENKKGEDGEISETNRPEPPKKMSVEFPGMHAPIPENADEDDGHLGFQVPVHLGIDHTTALVWEGLCLTEVGALYSMKGIHQLSRSHSSLPYLSPNQVFSPPSYGSASIERQVDESRNAFSPNFSSHHHHSRR